MGQCLHSQQHLVNEGDETSWLRELSTGLEKQLEEINSVRDYVYVVSFMNYVKKIIKNRLE